MCVGRYIGILFSLGLGVGEAGRTRERKGEEKIQRGVEREKQTERGRETERGSEGLVYKVSIAYYKLSLLKTNFTINLIYYQVSLL